MACGGESTPTNEDVTSTEAAEEVVDLDTDVQIHPIFHGSVVLTKNDLTIFVDPYGGSERYTSYGAPDLVLITHTHPDHLNPGTLAGIDLSEATLVGPAAVTEQVNSLGDSITFMRTETMANGDNYVWKNVDIAAVPAYNVRDVDFHPQGKFNGYVVTIDGQRLYFSGDTGPVQEMRDLKEIDIAFVCMNMPYTMTVESAAEAVLDFKPDVVYPYHYRNQDETFSDVERFRELVTTSDNTIEVRLNDWYTDVK